MRNIHDMFFKHLQNTLYFSLTENISLEDCNELAVLFEKNSDKITGIKLSYKYLPDNGFDIIAPAITKNAALQDLSTCDATDKDVLGIAHILTQKQSIKVFIFSCVEIADTNMHMLVSALINNKSIIECNISVKKMSESHADSLVTLIEQNSQIKKFHLSFVEASSDSIKKIADALMKNTTLKTLDLELPAAAVPQVIYGIVNNNTLIELSLLAHGLTDVAVLVTMKSLEKNPRLLTIELAFLGILTIDSIIHASLFNTAANRIRVLCIQFKDTLDFLHLAEENAILPFTNDSKMEDLVVGCRQSIIHFSKKQKDLNLNLSKCNLNIQEVQSLIKLLSYPFTKLSLFETIINWERNKQVSALDLLMPALSTNPSLKYLSIHSRFTNVNTGWQDLFNTLANNKVLNRLEIQNQILDNEGRPIAALLSTNTALKELKLSKRLLDGDAELIGAALKDNTSLQKLRLECNDITGRGAEFIRKGLEQNFTLTEVVAGYANNQEIEALCERNLKIAGPYALSRAEGRKTGIFPVPTLRSWALHVSVAKEVPISEGQLPAEVLEEVATTKALPRVR